MAQLRTKLILIVALLPLTVACADPVEGVWRDRDTTNCAPGNTDRTEFEVFSDLTGEGDVCSCDFDFDVDPRGDGRYRVDIKFDSGCAGFFVSDGKYDCELERDDTQLDCNNLGRYELID